MIFYYAQSRNQTQLPTSSCTRCMRMQLRKMPGAWVTLMDDDLRLRLVSTLVEVTCRVSTSSSSHCVLSSFLSSSSSSNVSLGSMSWSCSSRSLSSSNCWCTFSSLHAFVKPGGPECQGQTSTMHQTAVGQRLPRKHFTTLWIRFWDETQAVRCVSSQNLRCNACSLARIKVDLPVPVWSWLVSVLSVQGSWFQCWFVLGSAWDCIVL